MRGTQNLLFDLIDCPDNVHKALDTLEELWWKFHAEFEAIIDPGNHGCYTIPMRLLSPEPMECGTCDFSAMISPEMFGEFVMPFLRRQADHFGGRIVWHLDGPGELPHLEHLLPFEGVHAIQWVSGAGNPHGMDPAHDDLYRRILDAGKKIVTGGPSRPEVLKSLFDRFPREAFCLNFTVGSREEAEALMRAAGL
jgi:5-methyltetrahydrofolate--homocysteine methyltransferase